MLERHAVSSSFGVTPTALLIQGRSTSLRPLRLQPEGTWTPTPHGRFRIVSSYRHPWWYPPDSNWAQDLDPIPPGRKNPLGTRWVGLSVPGVGIHGTPNPPSVGYSVSHGCIRMKRRDAESLFRLVRVGTRVWIV